MSTKKTAAVKKELLFVVRCHAAQKFLVKVAVIVKSVYCVRLLYDLSKSPPNANAKLEKPKNSSCTKAE
jgi:hypothetical protein